jgi:hypothetical protein
VSVEYELKYITYAFSHYPLSGLSCSFGHLLFIH